MKTEEIIKELLGNEIVLGWAKKEGVGEITINNKEFADKLGYSVKEDSITMMSNDVVCALTTNATPTLKSHTRLSIEKLRQIIALVPKDDSSVLIVGEEAGKPALIVSGNNVIVIAPRVGESEAEEKKDEPKEDEKQGDEEQGEGENE